MAGGGGPNGTRGAFKGITLTPQSVFTSVGTWSNTGGVPTSVKTSNGATDMQAFNLSNPVIPTGVFVVAVRGMIFDNRPALCLAGLGWGKDNGAGAIVNRSIDYLKTAQSIVSGPSPVVYGTVSDATAWTYLDPGTNLPWALTGLNALLGICLDYTTTSAFTSFGTVGADLWMASYPLAPAVTLPVNASTVIDTLTPVVAWSHNDLQTSTVTNKVLTTNVATLTTSAAHGYQVGNIVTVTGVDATFNGTFPLTAVTGTTFSYAKTAANVGTVASGGTSTLGDNSAQSSAEVRVFTAAQYGAGGFSPDTTVPVYTGTISGAAASLTTAALTNATTYRAYVRTSKLANTTVLTSAWAFTQFTLAVPVPTTPTITAVLDNAAQRVQLTVAGFGNVLSAQDSNFEDSTLGTGTWQALVNMGAPARSTAQASAGSASMLLSSTAAGTMDAINAQGLAGKAVQPGQAWCGIADFRAVASARTVGVKIRWYDAAGAFLSDSAISTTGTAESTGAFVTRTVNATAPASAAFAALIVEVQATGGAAEQHYVDKVALAPGTSVGWNAGGATYTFAVTRTQNGVTTPVRALSPVLGTHQDLVLFDYEATRGVPSTYSVTEVATYPVGATSTLPGTAAPVTPSNDGTWWVKAPLLPSLNVGAGTFRIQKGSLTYTRMEDQGLFRPLGRTRPVVVHGDLEGEDGAMTLEVFGATEWAAIYPVLLYQATLLLQDPDGSQKYITLTSPRTWNRTAGATARRQVPVPYVEVDVP